MAEFRTYRPKARGKANTHNPFPSAPNWSKVLTNDGDSSYVFCRDTFGFAPMVCTDSYDMEPIESDVAQVLGMTVFFRSRFVGAPTTARVRATWDLIGGASGASSYAGVIGTYLVFSRVIPGPFTPAQFADGWEAGLDSEVQTSNPPTALDLRTTEFWVNLEVELAITPEDAPGQTVRIDTTPVEHLGVDTQGSQEVRMDLTPTQELGVDPTDSMRVRLDKTPTGEARLDVGE